VTPHERVLVWRSTGGMALLALAGFGLMRLYRWLSVTYPELVVMGMLGLSVALMGLAVYGAVRHAVIRMEIER